MRKGTNAHPQDKSEYQLPDNIHLNILVPQDKLDVTIHPPPEKKTVAVHPPPPPLPRIISGTALIHIFYVDTLYVYP